MSKYNIGDFVIVNAGYNSNTDWENKKVSIIGIKYDYGVPIAIYQVQNQNLDINHFYEFQLMPMNDVYTNDNEYIMYSGSRHSGSIFNSNYVFEPKEISKFKKDDLILVKNDIDPDYTEEFKFKGKFCTVLSVISPHYLNDGIRYIIEDYDKNGIEIEEKYLLEV